MSFLSYIDITRFISKTADLKHLDSQLTNVLADFDTLIVDKDRLTKLEILHLNAAYVKILEARDIVQKLVDAYSNTGTQEDQE